jgi:hypothetical protein
MENKIGVVKEEVYGEVMKMIEREKEYSDSEMGGEERRKG